MATTEQDTTPEAPAEKDTKATTRTYVVLKGIAGSGSEEGNPDTFDLIGTAVASNDRAAITTAAGADAEGTFVAIPERSFQRRTRGFKQPPPVPVWS